jgi:hypothetical protein
MRLFKWPSAACAIFLCACASKLYNPDSDHGRLSEAEAFHLAEMSLAEEMKHPTIVPNGDPHPLHIRIGDRSAPAALLARLETPRPFVLRPDPTDKPARGSCVQVNFPRGSNDDPEIVEVSIEYGHSHPHSIQMDVHGTGSIYRRQQAEWVLVRTVRWIE